MLELGLTDEQRATACDIIRYACVFQYANIGSAKEYGIEHSLYADTIIRLPFPGGVVCLHISDDELINALKTIDADIVAHSSKVKTLLESISGTAPEE